MVSDRQPPNMVSLMQPSATDSGTLYSPSAGGEVNPIPVMPPPEELRDKLTELLVRNYNVYYWFSATIHMHSTV